MSNNLDLEIKKALNNKTEWNHMILFTVKASSEIKVDFKINKDEQIISASYEQTPYHIQHTYKNVTMTYYSWTDSLSENVHDEITIHYETKRRVDKTDELEPIVKEMIQEIINAKNKHIPN